MRILGIFLLGLVTLALSKSVAAQSFIGSKDDTRTTWFFSQYEKALTLDASDSAKYRESIAKDTNEGVFYKFMEATRKKDNISAEWNSNFEAFNADLEKTMKDKGFKIKFAPNVDPLTKAYTLYKLYKEGKDKAGKYLNSNTEMMVYMSQSQIDRMNKMFAGDAGKASWADRMEIKAETDLGLVDRKFSFEKEYSEELSNLLSQIQAEYSKQSTEQRTIEIHFGPNGTQVKNKGGEALQALFLKLNGLIVDREHKVIKLPFKDGSSQEIAIPSSEMNLSYNFYEMGSKRHFVLPNWPLSSSDLGGNSFGVVQSDPQTGMRELQLRKELGNVDKATLQIFTDSPTAVLDAFKKTKVSFLPKSNLEDLIPELRKLHPAACETI